MNYKLLAAFIVATFGTFACGGDDGENVETDDLEGTGSNGAGGTASGATGGTAAGGSETGGDASTGGTSLAVGGTGGTGTGGASESPLLQHCALEIGCLEHVDHPEECWAGEKATCDNNGGIYAEGPCPAQFSRETAEHYDDSCGLSITHYLPG